MNTNKLIEENLDLVCRLVKDNINKPPFCYMEKDELISAGNFGLVEAAHNFQDGECSFRTFASPRIIGEMRDTERRLRWGEIRKRVMIQQLDDYEDRCPKTNEFYSEITDHLDADSKRVFIWYYCYNYTLNEIAEFLKLTESGVLRILIKAKNSIRSLYEPHELFSLLG